MRSQYFAGTPQVPGSNLRYEDYIFGTGEQLERALRDILAERRYSMAVVIQTPGTSLMGEGLESLIQENSRGISDAQCLYWKVRNFPQIPVPGYDETMARLLKQFVGEKGRERKPKIRQSISSDFAPTSRVWKGIRRKSGGCWDCAASR